LYYPEQLEKTREKQEKLEHDNMLRRELKQFREELESKYKNSEANRKYIFPRLSLEDELSDEKDIPVIDRKNF